MGQVANVVVGAVAGFFTGGPVGAVVGAVGAFAAGQAAEQRQEALQNAQQEQQRANAINNAQQALARRRGIRQALAEQRVRAATIEQRAFDSGRSNISGAITGDTASAIGAANTQGGAAFGISQAQDRASGFINESRSTNFWDNVAGVANLAGTSYSLYQKGAFDGIGSIFSSATPQAPVVGVFEGGPYAGR